MGYKPFIATAIIAASILLSVTACNKSFDNSTVGNSEKARLGKLIFFDTTLSRPVGQGCASCHSPGSGFGDPLGRIVAEGAVKGLAANRNAPGIAYSMFAPARYFDTDDSVFVGGLFLDGRANSLEEQATKPFFNPLEMNLSDPAMLAGKVRAASFFPMYERIYGPMGNDPALVLKNVAEALATFERTPDLNPFSSKFDRYMAGAATLTPSEERGFNLFKDTARAKCANCHVVDPDEASGKILFTDFTYDNIGLPRNPANPFYAIPRQYNPDGKDAIDLGLGAITGKTSDNGKFKVPTLRNAALTAPYGHNGVFRTLEEVVHFYNKRDVEIFPAPEVMENVNKEELGNLKLTKQEEIDIVAFIKTLSDGYK